MGSREWVIFVPLLLFPTPHSPTPHSRFSGCMREVAPHLILRFLFTYH